MGTWRDNNYIKRIREAEEASDYLDDLKKLICGELVASMQYEIASKGIIGSKNFNVLKDHFEKHADEERDHYEELVDALMERSGETELNLISIIQNALPETEELESFDCEYLREFFERAEKNAIDAYQNFYSKIEDRDKVLADIINEITSEEMEHKLDFSRLVKNGEVVEAEPEEEPKEEVEEKSTEEDTTEEDESEAEKKMFDEMYGNEESSTNQPVKESIETPATPSQPSTSSTPVTRSRASVAPQKAEWEKLPF